MELIKDLGILPISVGSKFKARFGIYSCTDCASEFKANSAKVKSRNTQICPTCSKDGRHRKTHGMKGTRIYSIWQNMNARCFKTYSTSYKDYGERGITMLPSWKDSFEVFYAWAQENGYSPDLEIDRVDTNGDYSPDNCRWTNKNVQNANRNQAKNAEGLYTGVYKHGNKYKLMVGYLSVPTYLGLFGSEEEAAIARNLYIEQNNLPHKICELKDENWNHQ